MSIVKIPWKQFQWWIFTDNLNLGKASFAQIQLYCVEIYENLQKMEFNQGIGIKFKLWGIRL